jgi:hypothetical protein
VTAPHPESPCSPRRCRAVTATLLSGCVSWFFPPKPETTSTPTGEQVDAALQPFYSQLLVWRAAATACSARPRGADELGGPAQATIELALVRQPATGEKRVAARQPRRPGGSGYDFVLDSVDYATSQRLQQNFDIVGFDPRGVGRSSAVPATATRRFLDEYNYGSSRASTVGRVDREPGLGEEFGAECLENTGPLLQYRRHDQRRARPRSAAGDPRRQKLNYLGYSYGTFLGATYAELYPRRPAASCSTARSTRRRATST